MLSPTHPVRSLLGPGRSMGAEPHVCSIYHMTACQRQAVKTSLIEINEKLPEVSELFDPDSELARPGYWLLDRFAKHIHFNFRQEKDLQNLQDLNAAYGRSRQPSHIAVATDASVSKEGAFQAIAGALILPWVGDPKVVIRPAGRA